MLVNRCRNRALCADVFVLFLLHAVVLCMFYAFKFVCCSPTDKFAIVTLPVCVYSVNAAAFVIFSHGF